MQINKKMFGMSQKGAEVIWKYRLNKKFSQLPTGLCRVNDGMYPIMEQAAGCVGILSKSYRRQRQSVSC